MVTRDRVVYAEPEEMICTIEECEGFGTPHTPLEPTDQQLVPLYLAKQIKALEYELDASRSFEKVTLAENKLLLHQLGVAKAVAAVSASGITEVQEERNTLKVENVHLREELSAAWDEIKYWRGEVTRLETESAECGMRQGAKLKELEEEKCHHIPEDFLQNTVDQDELTITSEELILPDRGRLY